MSRTIVFDLDGTLVDSLPGIARATRQTVEAHLGRAAPGLDTDAVRRMVGEEDGITDALFRFSRPVTGGYYWCPPCTNGRLDLSALGL